MQDLPGTAPNPALACERKLAGPAQCFDAAEALLVGILLPDTHYPVNTITSVYYDTRQLEAFGEKADGDNLKRKVRLRWYSGPEVQDEAFLEVKDRIGAARRKHRVVLRDTAWCREASLADARWISLLEQACGVLPEPFPGRLVPSVRIAYERRRYTCGRTGARVALDRGIRVEKAHPDLFPFAGPVSIDTVVLEFKDAQARSMPWLDQAVRLGFRIQSFSKYGEAVTRLLQGGCPV